MYLSRIELADDAECHPSFWRAIGTDYGAHQAVWRLFRRSEDQRRDFLFRIDERSPRREPRIRFYVLSAEEPRGDQDGLWQIETRRFAPALRRGDRLQFLLRASPTVKKPGASGKPARHDVVMDAKRRRSSDEPFHLARTIAIEGERWLKRQAERSGFELEEKEDSAIDEEGLVTERRVAALRVEGYRQHLVPRQGQSPIRFSSMEFEGTLRVTDPALFLERIRSGFGAQKAFGCGLMLLKRARD